MRKIRIEKITLNIGAGKDQAVLEKGIQLLKSITGIAPVKTKTKKRIPTWGLRPGLPIGCKLTMRGEKAEKIASRLLKAKDNLLNQKQFDSSGNVSFGIHEYIDIPDAEYDPKIGIMGLEVCITLERPGYRVKRRFAKKRKIGKRHSITRDEAIGFMAERFGIKVDTE